MSKIRRFERQLVVRLLAWSVLSIAAGVVLQLHGGDFARAFGVQALAWGAVDAGIAGFAAWSAWRKHLADQDVSWQRRQSHRLRRILWINAGLDVLYILAGLGLTLTLGQNSAGWKGHGWGIIIQGSFLLFFDLFHAQHTPPAPPEARLRFFDSSIHRSFRLEGRKPAALLVHGFPGTPAEMLPLGESLNRQGWTVEGLLLPGFGPEISSLGECSPAEWQTAIQKALDSLQAVHSPVLLVGYSLGGALASCAAARCATAGRPVDGLALLAPFVWEAGWERAALPLLRLALPYLRPFARAGSRGLAADMAGKLLSGMDLAELESPAALREFVIPVRLIEEIFRAGTQATACLSRIQAPALVVQGRHDPLAKPRRTRHALASFASPPVYIELEAGHDLVSPAQPAWLEVEKALVDFAGSLLAESERST